MAYVAGDRWGLIGSYAVVAVVLGSNNEELIVTVHVDNEHRHGAAFSGPACRADCPAEQEVNAGACRCERCNTHRPRWPQLGTTTHPSGWPCTVLAPELLHCRSWHAVSKRLQHSDTIPTISYSTACCFARCKFNSSSRARISSSLKSAGQPYAAKTAASSFLCARSSQVGR